MVKAWSRFEELILVNQCSHKAVQRRPGPLGLVLWAGPGRPGISTLQIRKERRWEEKK